MGLDWIVEHKPRNEKVDSFLLEKKVDEQQAEIDECWRGFCSALGKEVPYFFPNDLYTEFMNLDSTKEMVEALKKHQSELAKLYVSPSETIGAPKIGVDSEADQWIKANWDTLNTDGADGKQLTFDEFVTENFGNHILEARPEGESGTGKVTGILGDPTSFRGKVLGFVEWLPSDLKARAYEDQPAEELIEYGAFLKQAAKDYEASKGGEVTTTERREIDLVKHAGDWCDYWGKAGHSMHAWY